MSAIGSFGGQATARGAVATTAGSPPEAPARRGALPPVTSASARPCTAEKARSPGQRRRGRRCSRLDREPGAASPFGHRIQTRPTNRDAPRLRRYAPPGRHRGSSQGRPAGRRRPVGRGRRARRRSTDAVSGSGGVGFPKHARRCLGLIPRRRGRKRHPHLFFNRRGRTSLAGSAVRSDAAQVQERQGAIRLRYCEPGRHGRSLSPGRLIARGGTQGHRPILRGARHMGLPTGVTENALCGCGGIDCMEAGQGRRARQRPECRAPV